jgi:hypothetical protein
VEPTHRRRHLEDLHGRYWFLRALQPDSDRYRVWLGDLTEFVNVAYGADSDEMTRLRSVMIARGRPARDATAEERARAYVERLDALAGLLAALQAEIPPDTTIPLMPATSRQALSDPSGSEGDAPAVG